METRCVKDFVANLLQEVTVLSEINKNNYADIQDNPEITMLLQIEAKKAFEKLLNLLNEKSVCFDPINKNSLSCFYLYLRDRWNEMHRDDKPRTDNVYNLSPYSPINQACIALAKTLIKELPEIENQHIYDLLMPTCNFKQLDPLTNKPYYDLQLHQFVIGHEGKLLNIEWCFQCLETMAEEKRKRAATSSRYTARHNQLNVVKLSTKDERLVSKHSVLANKYYDAIQSNQQLDVVKRDFLDALKQNEYVVTASYGEQNKDFLMETILKDIVSSARGLTNFIYSNKLNKDQWTSFLKLVPKNDLLRIMLGINLNEQNWVQKSEATLNEILKANYPFKNQDEIRVFILSVLEVYEIVRKEKEEFNSIFGKNVGYYFGLAHDKETKLKAANVYREFLTSKYDITDLNGYLIQRGLFNNFSSLLIPSTGYMDAIVSSISNNFLSHIVSLANKLATQLNQKPVVNSKYGAINLT